MAKDKPTRAPAKRATDPAWEQVKKTVTPLKGREATAAPALPPAPRPATMSQRTSSGRYVAATPRELPDEWFVGKPSAPTPQIDRRTRRKLVTGRKDFDRSVDLHGMTQDEAYATLIRVIEGCVRRGDRALLVVTGKGGRRFRQLGGDTPTAYRTRHDFNQHGGVLKRMVPLWLASEALRPFVHSYSDAAQDHGGEGALYVLLRRQPTGLASRLKDARS